MEYPELLSVDDILSMNRAKGNNKGYLFILADAFGEELKLVSNKNILAQNTLTPLIYSDVTSFYGEAAVATATAAVTSYGHNHNLRPRNLLSHK